MPAGASPKREREYTKLERQFRKEHRYKGREEEVAARIINKQRAEYGETSEELQKDRLGKSPDHNLPIENYQRLTISQIDRRLDGLPAAELRELRTYEAKHKNRKGVLGKLDYRLSRH